MGAREKLREAKCKDHEADESNKAAFNSVRSCNKLTDQVQEYRRTKSVYEREIEADKRRVAGMGVLLAAYKKEAIDCHYLSKHLRLEIERLTQLGQGLLEEADQVDNAVELTEVEIEKKKKEMILM